MEKFTNLLTDSLLEKEACDELVKTMNHLESAAKSMKSFVEKNRCNSDCIHENITEFENSLVSASTYLCEIAAADTYLSLEERSNVLLDVHDECSERFKVMKSQKKKLSRKTVIEETEDKTTVLTSSPA